MLIGIYKDNELKTKVDVISLDKADKEVSFYQGDSWKEFKRYYIKDANNLYVGYTDKAIDEKTDNDIEKQPDSSFIKPTWNGSNWIEGETTEQRKERILDESVRPQRNSLLANTDYTQLEDAPLTVEQKAEWATYRQSLRNLPANIEDIDNVVWPTEPQ